MKDLRTSLSTLRDIAEARDGMALAALGSGSAHQGRETAETRFSPGGPRRYRPVFCPECDEEHEGPCEEGR